MESAQAQLEQLIKSGEEFTFENFCQPCEHGSQYGGADTTEWLAWKTRNYNLVRQLTSDNSPAAGMVTMAMMEIRTEGNLSDKFNQAKTTFLKALHLTFEATKEDTFGELKQSRSSSGSSSLSNKVFVVHGHDLEFKTEVENFIHEIGLEPVVLHRKPDEGQAIIEKFEKHSDVGYAFILLTPDEIAYAVDKTIVQTAIGVKRSAHVQTLSSNLDTSWASSADREFAAYTKGMSHYRVILVALFTRKLMTH